MALTSVMAKHLTNKHKGGIRVCLLIKSHEEKAFGFAVHCRNSRPDKARSFVICNVASGSPAERSAVRRGDRILGVEGASVFDEPYKATVQRLKAAHGQLSMILLVAEPEAFAEYSALGLPMNALLPGAIVVIGEPPGDSNRKSSQERKGKHHDISLENDAESLDEVISYLDALPQEEDERASKYDKLLSIAGEGTSSDKKSLFTRLRRMLRRRHNKKDDRDRFVSLTAAEHEDCTVTSLPLAADCAVTSLSLTSKREDCVAMSNLTYGREHHDSSLEEDAESVDTVINFLDALSPEDVDEFEIKHEERRSKTDEEELSSKKSLFMRRRRRKTNDRRCSTSSVAAERAECGATSLPPAVKRAECGATLLQPAVTHEKCGATLSPIACKRSVKLPLIERVQRMLSRLGHHEKHSKCTSLTSEATSFPPAAEPAECEATLTPTFISTLSIRLKPAQLPQQKHSLYQLHADRSLKTLLT
jgi:hypothetical protein